MLNFVAIRKGINTSPGTSEVVLILTVLKANLVKLVIGDLVLKAKLVLILTVLKVKFDCMYYIFL